ncbi:MAG: protease inhibitor I42 family protein [Hyphomonadaceae bacterium]|nr:protease inhibitor I42 family protein [Hyphomonadaceae bacterium]
MKIRAIAAAAGLGLALGGCNPEKPPEPETPVAGPTVDPAIAAKFENALNFECEGGGKLDVVLDQGAEHAALVRLDGGEPANLPLDADNQSGMAFTDKTTALVFDGQNVSYTSGAISKTCNFVSRSLPAPAVDGAVRNLNEEDAGASVEMQVGQKMSVSLSGVPTAGYVWGADAPPAFVKVSDGPGGATTSAQMLPGFAGGNHWEVLVIEAVAPGEAEIGLVQKRPWEDKADPDDKRFKFKLKVN